MRTASDDSPAVASHLNKDNDSAPGGDATMTDIDHPYYYNIGQIEVIDAIEAWQLDFCEGNVVKYVARAKHKGNRLDDLRKARWYLDRLIGTLERHLSKSASS